MQASPWLRSNGSLPQHAVYHGRPLQQGDRKVQVAPALPSQIVSVQSVNKVSISMQQRVSNNQVAQDEKQPAYRVMAKWRPQVIAS